MSTGLECEFIEPAPHQWFYILQDGSCPRQVWDWREYATCYGPFASYEEAHEHLRANHANPGGGCITSQEHYKAEDLYTKLIERAHK